MKFAYLIIAHDNEQQLRLLIEALDFEENDIYLHIDKKSKLKGIRIDTKKAHLYVYNKFSVYWGDMSLTKCQLYLLKEALQEYHDFYHMISGQDFPIKPHKDILRFFEKNKGKQFIHFESEDYCMKEACRYYHFLAPILSRCHEGYIKRIIRFIEKKLLLFQKKMSVNRKIYCGSNWFSVTHEFALELCSKQTAVLRKIKWTVASDEYVLQTFYKTISTGKYVLFSETENEEDYHSVAREIDWKRGEPYVWRNSDFDYLMNSNRMFARKFDQQIDGEIIRRLAMVVKQ